MKTLLGEDRYAKSQQTDTDTAAANLRSDFAKANPTDAQFQQLIKPLVPQRQRQLRPGPRAEIYFLKSSSLTIIIDNKIVLPISVIVSYNSIFDMAPHLLTTKFFI